MFAHHQNQSASLIAARQADAGVPISMKVMESAILTAQDHAAGIEQACARLRAFRERLLGVSEPPAGNAGAPAQTPSGAIHVLGAIHTSTTDAIGTLHKLISDLECFA